MDWMKVSIDTVKEAEEIISDVLLSTGATGVQIEGDIPEDAQNLPKELFDQDSVLGEPFTVSAYFGCGNTENNILAEVKRRLDALRDMELDIPLGSLDVRTEILSDKDWENAWKAYFKPTWISDFVVIKPTWEEYTQEGEEIIVQIDPGMAFGTGTHPTTRMCVRFLEEYLEPEMHVIDVGSGSGILSVIAALFGAGEVLALDMDEVAVSVTASNAQVNGCEGIVQAVQSDLLKQAPEGKQADIIVANIISDIIIDLLDEVHGHLKKNGMFICSGVIDSRVDEIIATLEANNYRVIKILEEGEWRAIASKYKP
ncbi:MAG: 50S ribosomal protein L11 methyltransferase [Christensenellaceae bacterium]|jgi:ribosomal protein L11 methyltransferase